MSVGEAVVIGVTDPELLRDGKLLCGLYARLDCPLSPIAVARFDDVNELDEWPRVGDPGREGGGEVIGLPATGVPPAGVDRAHQGVGVKPAAREKYDAVSAFATRSMTWSS